MGPYDGGQAEYLRVPFADFNLLKLPSGTEFERDFTMLSDIFPTGYHGTALAEVSPGDTVVVFGAGPVGLLAAHSSYLRGAARVFAVDLQPDRLALAERFGATPVSIADGDPAEQVLDATGRRRRRLRRRGRRLPGPRPRGEEHPEMVMDNLVQRGPLHRRPRRRRRLRPAGPGAATEGAKDGRIGFDFGTLFQQGPAARHRPVPGQAL